MTGARTYDPDDLDRILPPLPGPQRGQAADRGTGDEPPVRLAGEDLATWRGEHPKRKDDGTVDRSATLLKIGRVLRKHHLTRRAIVAALAERDAQLFEKYTGRQDAAEQYHRIVDALEREQRPHQFGSFSRNGHDAGPPAAPAVSDEPPEEPRLTDVGNGERLARTHGHELRYAEPLAGWFHYEGGRWQPDKTGAVDRRAKQIARGFYHQAATADEDLRAALLKHAKHSNSAGGVAAMIRMAQSEPGIAVLPEQFDTDPWAFVCRNGTIDLRAGDLHPSRRDDLNTRLAPVSFDPEADCPIWRAFLARSMADDAALIAFLARTLGYSLTGDTSEQCMFVMHGSGENGKSTFIRTVKALLGDYAATTSDATFGEHSQDRVPNSLAALRGARFVDMSETEAGQRLAEKLIKRVTGQDAITARFLYHEDFTFVPTFKLWLSTNHKPEIRDAGRAMWRRVHLIPFEVTIPKPEQDKQLEVKLRRELPGILAWAVRGCLDWQARGGLEPPDKVIAATRAYREEMDVLGPFLAERCTIDGQATVKFSTLYSAYTSWCEDNKERALSKRSLGPRLADHGLQPGKDGAGSRIYTGLRLRESGEQQPAPDDTDERKPISANSPYIFSHSEFQETGTESSVSSGGGYDEARIRVDPADFTELSGGAV